MRWLSFVLNSDAYCLLIQSIAHGTSDTMKKIQKGSFLKLPVLLPPLPERQKIADILGTWDEALEKLDALITAKARRKQALMQQLLTGHRRLPGFSKPWKQTRFGDLMESEDRYADFDDDKLYHLVSARRRAVGVFFREALHGRDIKTKVMKKVHAGDFLISRMQVVHGGLGVVPPECDGYYASDSYEVLVPRDPAKLSPRFIGHLCRMRRFWHHALVCSHGVHIEKMTFVMADFEHEKFMIPEIAEQRAIAAVLDTADAELRLLRQQRAALDHQKRGLMQQLLTGRIRVSL
jgi:type I restriction enzyme S subunit